MSFLLLPSLTEESSHWFFWLSQDNQKDLHLITLSVYGHFLNCGKINKKGI